MIHANVLISKCVPHPRNYNRHPQAQLDALQDSLAKFGQVRSVVVQDDGAGGFLIVAGHGVWEAARQSLASGEGVFAESPLGVAGELSADIIPSTWHYIKVSAYLAADNELARLGDPDREQLAQLVQMVADDDQALAMLAAGSDDALEALLQMAAEADFSGAGDDVVDSADVLAALMEKWPTAAGQLWEIPSASGPGTHRIICGDSTDGDVVTRLLAGQQPGLMVTDPPYGVNYDPTWRITPGKNRNPLKMGKVVNDDRADWRAAWQHFKGNVAYIWHSGAHGAAVAQSIAAAGFVAVNQIVWVKDSFVFSRGNYHWGHESCLYAVRAGKNHLWAGARDQSAVWHIQRVEDAGHGHGTQKPLECMARPIRNHTARLVYDPFLGSGTTILGCEKLRRIGLGVEISPGYLAVSLERLSLAGLEPVLLK